MTAKKDIQRLPRPFGATSIMMEYAKTGNAELLESLRTLFIHQWTIAGGKICGRHLNTVELAHFMKCSVGVIHDHMRKQVLESKIWNREDQEDLINAMMGQTLAWAMEDRMDIQNHVDILKRSQGDTYKPFISAEVTKALALKLSSGSNLQNMIRSAQGGGSINIFNNNNQQNNQQSLTVEAAVNLVTKQLEDIRPIEVVENSYDLKALPEVVATSQQGISVDKEGLNIRKQDLIEATDDYKGALEEFEETHHSLRREIEERIDQDEADPETYIYPG